MFLLVKNNCNLCQELFLFNVKLKLKLPVLLFVNSICFHIFANNLILLLVYCYITGFKHDINSSSRYFNYHIMFHTKLKTKIGRELRCRAILRVKI